MIEVIATWPLPFSFTVLLVSLETVPWAAALGQLAAETVGRVAKLVWRRLRRDHGSYLLMCS